MRIPVHVAIGALILMSAPQARAGTFLPLQVGNQWEYTGTSVDSGGNPLHETQTVIGTRTLRGSQVSVIEYSESAYNEGLQNFWASGPGGDVYLWGFYLASDGDGVVYDPPILAADAPLYLGKTWGQTVRVYSLLADTLVTSWQNITFTVTQESDLTVPAGTFHGFGIDYSVTPGPEVSPSGVVRLDGARRLSPTEEFKPWETFSENVGNLQYVSPDLLQLTRFDFPTPAITKTWGALKALYKQ